MRYVRMSLLVVALLLATLVAPSAADVVVLDDSDWREPTAASRVEGIERQMTPALLLKTEFKEPVFLFDPTDDETITTLTDFQGKLYLGSCTQPAETDTGSVFTYVPESHQWEKVFQVNEQGLTRLEVYSDQLYIPGYDANDGDWDLGNIYLHDGESWVERRTVPRAVHIYGLTVYRDRIYVSADILDEPPEGVSVSDAAEKGALDVYGRVASSGDGGQTWREEYRGPRPGQDVGFMTVFQNKLVLNAHGDLVLFDGEAWRRLGLNPNALVVFDYTDAGELLVLGTSLGLGLYDGQRFWLARVPAGHVRSVTRFGAYWLVMVTRIAGGTMSHGPGGTGYMRATKPYDTLLLLMTDQEFRDIAAGSMTSSSWDNVFWLHIRTADMGVSAHAFKGRLYLGTHPEGRVLVLPVVTEGRLDSAPRPIAAGGAYTLSWEAATPAGTQCRLQIRIAATRDMLEQQPFVGPDGSEASFFDAPAAVVRIVEPGFVQYRVLLTTENPALTPYLKRVTLRSGA